MLTGFKLNEQVNQGGGATASDLRSTEPIRTRFSEGAVHKPSDAIKAGNDAKKATQLKADSTDNKLGAEAVKKIICHCQ